MSGAIPSLPLYAFMVWYSVKKAQGLLYLLCIFCVMLFSKRRDETNTDQMTCGTEDCSGKSHYRLARDAIRNTFTTTTRNYNPN
jgi:hypothetical protein